ncbi:MAG: OmpA family protein [bacterium]
MNDKGEYMQMRISYKLFRFSKPAVLTVLTVLLLHNGLSAGAEEFRFKYQAGDKYRILSQVDEEVYINGRYSHQADILNRISVEIKDVDEGSGLLEGQFTTSETRSGQVSVYEMNRSYFSRFWRDMRGRYDIDPSYYMPVVRDVPSFPDKPVEVGDSWEASGEEVHDLRNGYGIPAPLSYPFRAKYRYLGKAEYHEKEYDLFSVQYTVRHRTSNYFRQFPIYPVRITGFSDQQVYWDREVGRPHAYTEQFSMIFSLSNGDQYEFTGTARAEVIESTPMDRDKIAEEVEKRLREDGVRDTRVKVDERGVTIDLENIQFAPDSTELLTGEQEKLNRIAEILRRYPDRDLLITGHTAMAGTQEGRMQLSQQRARVVGNYLLGRDIREPEQIIIQGKGAQEPIADNSTPEGMRRNRRVEITILEN